MKVAALYDIHGNLPALEAVLVDLENSPPDLVLVGGDIVAGPLPRQTLECLSLLGDRIWSLRGNADRAVVDAFDARHRRSTPVPPWKASTEGESVAAVWAAEQIEQSQRDLLAALPEQCTLYIDGLGDVLFCHATPRSDEEIFTALTPQERLASLFAGVEQDLVVCGHTHMQFERRVGSARILNAGSVGMPYADRPGAYWLWLGPEGAMFRHTAYDLEAAAQQVRECGYPEAERFVAENLLTVPTAAEAVEVFERAVAGG
jgi:predicted phosphodiesterase